MWRGEGEGKTWRGLVICSAAGETAHPIGGCWAIEREECAECEETEKGDADFLEQARTYPLVCLYSPRK